MRKKDPKMYNKEAKATFIKLRAEGVSYEAIAKQLHKSKSTVLRWGQEFKKEIQNIHFLEYQSLLEEYALTKKARIEFLTESLKKIKEAFKAKDFTQLPAKELVFMIEEYEKKLKNELADVQYNTGKMGIPALDRYDPDALYEITEKLV